MQIVRTWAAVVAAAAVALLLGSGARALPPDPIELRVDSYFPADSDTQRALSSNFVAFGVNLDVLQKNWHVPVTFGVYGDYFDRIRNTDTTGRVQARVCGIGLGVRYNLAPNEVDPGFAPYARVGAGVYNSYVKQDTPDGFTQSNQRTSIGGKFNLGVQHRSGIFAEGGYSFVPHPSLFDEDVALSGWTAGIGIRF